MLAACIGWGTNHYEPNGDKEWHADAFRIVVIPVEQPKVLLDY